MRPASSRLRALGPGLLFAGAAIGASHLVQSTRAGAGWGFTLLWPVILILVLKYPFFEYAHRYTAATNESLLHGFRRVGRGALLVFFAIAIVSSVVNAAAVTAVTAGLCGTLLGVDWTLPQLALLVLVLVAAILAVGRYQTLDRTMKVMISLLGVLTLIAVAVAAVHGPIGDIHVPRPDLWTASGIAFLLALMGFMPAPIDISAWSSLWTLAKNREEHRRVSVSDCRFDFVVGYTVTGVLAVAFVCFGALVMFGTGTDFSPSGLVFSRQLITMYTQTLGAWSGRMIGVVAFITMFSTTLTVCDGYTRTLVGCWRLLRAGDGWAGADAAGGRTGYVGLLVAIMAVSWGIIAAWLRGLTALVDVATITAFLTAPVVGWLNFKVVRLDTVPVAERPGPGMRALSWAGLVYLVGFGFIYLLTRWVA